MFSVVKGGNIIRIVSDYQKVCQCEQWTCTQQLETELCGCISLTFPQYLGPKSWFPNCSCYNEQFLPSEPFRIELKH